MMKRTIRIMMTVMAMAMLYAVTACAGSGTMEERHMKSDQMKSDQMKSDQMKSDQMMDDKMAPKKMGTDKMMDKEMKDSGMSGDKMMKDTMHEKTMAAPVMSMLSGSDGHHAAGTVTITEEMGHYVLTLADIKVDKVPDGQVYLSKGGDRMAGIHLGMLKQFTGTVKFALPANADPAMYDSVIIYCEKFNVEIGHAPLTKKM